MRKEIIKDFDLLADEKKALHLAKFFKTGKGQYAEGDKFLGINVPKIKSLATKYYQDISLTELTEFLNSPLHDYRFFALQCLVKKYEKAKEKEIKQEIVNFYLENIKGINNWDLVDCSAHKIIGAWSKEEKDIEIIKNLADSQNLWQERIAIVASWYFIKQKQYGLTLSLAQKFINHPHDLIHKAVGWMLREVGKQDQTVLIDFLDINGQKLPRTTLRYAIERFSKEEREKYLQKK